MYMAEFCTTWIDAYPQILSPVIFLLNFQDMNIGHQEKHPNNKVQAIGGRLGLYPSFWKSYNPD